MSDAKPLPSFTGLVVYRDLSFRYSLFLPDGWHRLALVDEAGSGAFYAPTTDESFTGFSAQARDLGTSVSAEDLTALHAGFLRGLRKLPRSRIESHEADAIGRLVTMEARHTYVDAGIIRKRWVRLLYQGSTQVRLVAQGATVGAFDYWLPMFYEAMRTVRFGDWAVDAGVPGWRPSVLEG